MFAESPTEQVREVESAARQPCPVCGGTNFEWGFLYRVAYLPGPKLRSLRSGAFVVKVRRCLECNNTLQFIDPEVTAREKQDAVKREALFVIFLLVLVPVIYILLQLISR